MLTKHLLLQSESSARMVNTLLTELDGLEARKSVYVIAATNRPDMIDPAMVRPGRLDKLLYVDLPTRVELVEILRTLMRKVPVGSSVLAADGMIATPVQVRSEIERAIAEGCDGYSGADLAALVREAGVNALRRTLGAIDEMDENAESPTVLVGLEDFIKAMEKVTPSVSAAQRKKYQNLRSKFAGLPVRVGKEEEEKRIEEKASPA